MNSKVPVKGNLATWYKFTFAVCRKRNSKSLYYLKKKNGSTAPRIGLIYLKYNYRDTECVKLLTETEDITNLYRAFVN